MWTPGSFGLSSGSGSSFKLDSGVRTVPVHATPDPSVNLGFTFKELDPDEGQSVVERDTGLVVFSRDQV
jgi:hypothetical protein